MRWLTLLLLALPLPAAAQTPPRYVDVTGVAANDTLNVRAAPTANAPDIGDLAPFATGIEVIATDPTSRWGRILWHEGNGWIALRFTTPSAQPMITGTRIPARLQCTGTEPFWSLNLHANGALFTDLGGSYLPLALGSTHTAQGYAAFPTALVLDAPTDLMLATLRPLTCSDSMSDRDYGWTVDIFHQSPKGAALYAGCCRLPLDAGQH